MDSPIIIDWMGPLSFLGVFGVIFISFFDEICNISRWLKKLWNETISPVVKVGVVKGTGKEPVADGQQKVANTALYVLMQRAIVPGCPLTGDGKK